MRANCEGKCIPCGCERLRKIKIATEVFMNPAKRNLLF